MLSLARAFSTKGTRIASTLVGHSGREYVREKILKSHQTKLELNVCLARQVSSFNFSPISLIRILANSGDDSSRGHELFVLKPVSESIFNLSLNLKTDFPHSSRLRLHTDYNGEEHTLVYEYFKDDLLSLVKDNENLTIGAIKEILWELGQGLKELHEKNWIHIDVKPDNVMVDWSPDEEGRPRIERVALGDLDCSLKLKDEKLLQLPDGVRLGNFMWRSPEVLTGKGIGKASDVFSYALVCLYVLTNAETLHPDFEELRKDGVVPEMEILGRLFAFFGPLPQGLLTHINDTKWANLLTDLSEGMVDVDPSYHFEQWEEKDYRNLSSNTKSNTKRVISRMANLNPAKRATMAEVLEDP